MQEPPHSTPRKKQGSRCPVCRKPLPAASADPAGGSLRPFCSERCRLIDLGRWLDGAYQIPAEEPDGGTGPAAPDAGDDEPPGRR